MRRVPRFLTTIASAALVLAFAAGATSAGASTAPRRSTGLEAAIAQEVNTTRIARGLRTLTRSQGLVRAADTHTVAMFGTGMFDHDLPGFPTFGQRMRRFYAPGTVAWGGAENLALFGPDEPSAHDVVALWLASPPHRAALLDRGWRELGVSVRFDDSAGGEFDGRPTWLITLDLGRRG